MHSISGSSLLKYFFILGTFSSSFPAILILMILISLEARVPLLFFIVVTFFGRGFLEGYFLLI